jgi:hypothetical protein
VCVSRGCHRSINGSEGWDNHGLLGPLFLSASETLEEIACIGSRARLHKTWLSQQEARWMAYISKMKMLEISNH